MSTFVLFEKLQNENHYGHNLPVAVLVRLSDGIAGRLASCVKDVEADIFSRLEINIQPNDVRWLSLVAFDSEGGLSPIPGWFDPARDQIVYAADSANMEYEDGAVEFADACQVYSHEGIPSSVLTLEKHNGGVLLGAAAETTTHWALHTLCESWETVATALGAATTSAKEVANSGSKAPQPIQIIVGVSEDGQEGGYMNSTLQSAGDKVAFSLETRLDVPAYLHGQGESAIAEFIKTALTQASAHVPGLSFAVAIGPSREAEEEQTRQRG